MYKRQKGFTLVEMIIVTVIIGILAGIVISVINIPRIQGRSRDSKRISDLKMIQSALELYFSQERAYPPNVDWLELPSNWSAISPGYLSTIPQDPRSGVPSGTTCFGIAVFNNYGYYYRSTTSGTYILGTIMEIMDTHAEHRGCREVDTPNCISGCVSTNTRCYCVQNPM